MRGTFDAALAAYATVAHHGASASGAVVLRAPAVAWPPEGVEVRPVGDGRVAWRPAIGGGR